MFALDFLWLSCAPWSLFRNSAYPIYCRGYGDPKGFLNLTCCSLEWFLLLALLFMPLCPKFTLLPDLLHINLSTCSQAVARTVSWIAVGVHR